MPMFINPRTLKRYLISKNLNSWLEHIKHRHRNPRTAMVPPALVLAGLELKLLFKTSSKLDTRCFQSWNSLLIVSSRVHGYLVQSSRTAFL